MDIHLKVEIIGRCCCILSYHTFPLPLNFPSLRVDRALCEQPAPLEITWPNRLLMPFAVGVSDCLDKSAISLWITF